MMQPEKKQDVIPYICHRRDLPQCVYHLPRYSLRKCTPKRKYVSKYYANIGIQMEPTATA